MNSSTLLYNQFKYNITFHKFEYYIKQKNALKKCQICPLCQHDCNCYHAWLHHIINKHMAIKQSGRCSFCSEAFGNYNKGIQKHLEKSPICRQAGAKKISRCNHELNGAIHSWLHSVKNGDLCIASSVHASASKIKHSIANYPYKQWCTFCCTWIFDDCLIYHQQIAHGMFQYIYFKNNSYTF